MIEKLLPPMHHSTETLQRSILKTVSYRVIILILDFGSIYLFTGEIKVAVSFMIVSNIYTSIGYFFHERIWDKIMPDYSSPSELGLSFDFVPINYEMSVFCRDIIKSIKI